MSDFQQYFIWISKNIKKDWVFAVFILNTMVAKQKKKKKKKIMIQLTKSFFRLASNLKKQ